MKRIALLLIIVLATVVHSRAQTVQKESYLLKSHVIKKHVNSAAKKDSLLAGPLTIEEKLMMVPFRNHLNDKINAPFTTMTKYLEATSIKHKLLLKSVNAAVQTWYTDKYNIDYFKYEWVHGWLQQSLNRPLPINPGNSTLFRSINKRWIQY
jgi:hypothetical protein